MSPNLCRGVRRQNRQIIRQIRHRFAASWQHQLPGVYLSSIVSDLR